jgi:hypothetical protein
VIVRPAAPCRCVRLTSNVIWTERHASVGLAFLPWERWRPPYVYGPIFILMPSLLFFAEEPPAWWHYLLAVFALFHGAWVTWMWARHGRNVLRETGGEAPHQVGTKE